MRSDFPQYTPLSALSGAFSSQGLLGLEEMFIESLL